MLVLMARNRAWLVQLRNLFMHEGPVTQQLIRYERGLRPFLRNPLKKAISFPLSRESGEALDSQSNDASKYSILKSNQLPFALALTNAQNERMD